MQNFSIHFTYPWLLLLLIPAAALTVFLYLRLNKKFRRTRNRIISIVLHSIVMVLCVLTLSGITFNYQIGNAENELILLVDVSDTTEETRQSKEEFIREVLREGAYDSCRVGIVTFGFTQKNAVPFTYDAGNAFDAYLSAELPEDVSATDIAAALQYARGLFEHPETGKIVLISDGKETDEQALSVIRSIASQGVLVDTVYFPGDYSDELVQITAIGLPDYNVKAGETAPIDVVVESRDTISGVTIELFDNGEPAGSGEEDSGAKIVDISSGTQSVRFEHVFRKQGLHELYARIQYTNETLQQNNEYYAYRWLQIHNKVLILEQADQSGQLIEVMKEDEVGYEITRGNLATGENVPSSEEDLRQFDQVILNNISSHDLEKDGLDALLYEYVYTYGGGLFTTGGMEEDGATAHAYNRSDMNNTLYQQMLPIQAINYTPPVGVFIVIDISGSMLSAGASGRSNLEWAKQGAIECLNALTERDYIGIMTMDTEYGMVLDLTPRTQDGLIREKILGIGEGQSTVYSTAIDRSAQRLAQLQNVDKRHIILVTDGMPADSDVPKYLKNTEDAYKNHGITLSVVGIGIAEGSTAYTRMTELVTTGHGRLHTVSNGSQLLSEMRDELNAPEIEETKYGDFNPTIANTLSPLLNGVEHGSDLDNRHSMLAQLSGFFGTKARSRADVILVGEYDVPIYAQWKFGEGMVGSFMCDVYSDWSAEFMTNENGKRFLRNVIANLMPLEDIRPTEVRLDLKEENYINRLSVYSSLEEGQYIDGKIVIQTDDGEVSYSLNSPSEVQGGDIYVTLALGSDNNYSRAAFVIKRGGLYTITVNKCAANGDVLETVSIYKAFAYSEEYDFSVEQDPAPEELMEELASRGNGEAISPSEPWEIFSTFVTTLDRVFDPRWLFMIIAMILFLADIAVRKFKFKWPHELIREYKEKKAGKQ